MKKRFYVENDFAIYNLCCVVNFLWGSNRSIAYTNLFLGWMMKYAKIELIYVSYALFTTYKELFYIRFIVDYSYLTNIIVMY